MKKRHIAHRNANPLLRLHLQRWRMRLVMSLILGGFTVLTVRAAWLQGWRTDFLNDEGEKRVNRVVPIIPPHRGMILDRHGEPLAISTPVESLWINPAKAGEKPKKNCGRLREESCQPPVTPQQVQALAACLHMEPDRLAKLFAEQDKTFVYLRRLLPPDVSRECQSLGIKGLYATPEFRRYYPAGEVFAHVVGLTDVEDRGLEGLEHTYDDWLAGEPGMKRVVRDRMGNVVEELDRLRMPKPGNDLALSYSQQIQYLAHRELSDAVARNQAVAGSIVVLDARTGEILAHANSPSYNPNNRETMNADRMRNRAATDVFEPGSTIKPFLVAASLEAGLIKPDTRIDTGGGYYYVGEKRINDVHAKGVLTVREALQVSSNVAAARIAMEMGLKAEDYWRLLSRAGFGSPPGSGMPGEAVGRLRPYDTWRPIEKATMAFGHGLSVSLLQLARAYTAFANDGVIPPLTVLKRNEGVIGQRVMSAETAREVRAMLELVTQDGGTAPLARVNGYRVAGKTGTAHKLVGGGYAADKYISSFVGLAPASDPRLVVAVMIDEPGDGRYYGGLVAGPVFSRVMAGAIRLMALPPDAPMGAESAPNLSAPVIREGV